MKCSFRKHISVLHYLNLLERFKSFMQKEIYFPNFKEILSRVCLIEYFRIKDTLEVFMPIGKLECWSCECFINDSYMYFDRMREQTLAQSFSIQYSGRPVVQSWLLWQFCRWLLLMLWYWSLFCKMTQRLRCVIICTFCSSTRNVCVYK